MSDSPPNNDDGSTGSKLRQWSSLIGIITAIIGNVLISFALNIQRYAHLRLRQGRGKGQLRRSKRRAEARIEGYGTQQIAVADERAHLNLNTPYPDKNNGGNSAASTTREGSNDEDDGNDQDQTYSLHSRRSSTSSDREFEKESSGQQQPNYLKSPYWWLGLVFMIVGEAGNFLAYGFAPASTVSPLGVVALISNCIIAPCMLKEQFRQRDFWGVVVAIAGAVIIVFSAKNSETKMGPDDIWAAISRWEFETYLGITAALIAFLIWLSGKYGNRTILIDLGVVALCGGYTALTTKGVASLLSDTLWRTLTFPITYLLLFILILTAVMQIRYVNRALQHFPSTQVIPTQFVLFTISVIVGSAILYRDFKSASGSDIGKFIGGCFLTFLGVYLITSGRRRSSSLENEGVVAAAEGPITLIDEERYQDELDPLYKDNQTKRTSTSVPSDIQDGHISRGVRPSQDSAEQLKPVRPSVSSQSSSAVSPTQSPPDHPVLLENPWQSADDIRTSKIPPPLEETVSSPILPSEAQRNAPSVPPNDDEAVTPSTPRTPPALPETPTRETRPETRPSRLSRRSIAHFTPGPYMSPLSSSLSAVVADSIRKGKDQSSSKYRRPPLSALRKSASQRDTPASTGHVPTVSTPLKPNRGQTQTQPQAQAEEQDADTGQIEGSGTENRNRSRGRSLSTSLKDFFRLSRERERKGKQSQTQSQNQNQNQNQDQVTGVEGEGATEQ